MAADCGNCKVPHALGKPHYESAAAFLTSSPFDMMTTLPHLLPADDVTPLLAAETQLADLAGTLIQSNHSRAADMSLALNAIVLANELLWAHESEHPADVELHHAATQLKCHFLARLDYLTNGELPQV